MMNENKCGSSDIGVGWIAAIIILLVLLIIGVVLYLRLGVPEPVRNAPSSSGSHAMIRKLQPGGFTTLANGYNISERGYALK